MTAGVGCAPRQAAWGAGWFRTRRHDGARLASHPNRWLGSILDEDTFNVRWLTVRECKTRLRAEKLTMQCPNCGSKNLTEPRPFNYCLHARGATAEDDADALLFRLNARDFMNFLTVLNTVGETAVSARAVGSLSHRGHPQFYLSTREVEPIELDTSSSVEDEEAHQNVSTRATWVLTSVCHGNLRLYEQPKGRLRTMPSTTWLFNIVLSRRRTGRQWLH